MLTTKPEAAGALAHPSTVSLIALVLTLVTIVNTVFKPSENALLCAHTLVQLHDWETDLVAGLLSTLTAEPKPGDAKILEFLVRKDKELSKIGVSLADRFSPQPLPPSDSKNHDHDGASARAEADKRRRTKKGA